MHSSIKTPYFTSASSCFWVGFNQYCFSFNGKEKIDEINGTANDLDFGARIYDSRLSRFLSIDKYSNKYPFFSPYLYAGNSPIQAIDVNGDSLYILTYTIGNGRGDDMLKSMALTRKYDIEHSGHFDPARDKVAMIEINDVSDIKNKVNQTITTFSLAFGKTSEFSIWSHAGGDGPAGSVYSKKHNLSWFTGLRIDQNQMSLNGWAEINFNWSSKANAYFYGCGTGDPSGNKPSFTTSISGLSNFKNIAVFGIVGNGYPSEFADTRNPTHSQYKENFNVGAQSSGNEKTYMVGGESGDTMSYLGYGITYPMRKSVNGSGKVNNGQYGPGDKQ
jgi:RHS repeat-associated protein